MAGLELLHDRDNQGGLCFDAFVAADLEGEPVAVDQQPDHDLRVDAAFLGVADLPEVVLVLGLEVERGHVVEHQRHIPVRDGVVEAGSRNLIAIHTLATALQLRGIGVAVRQLSNQPAQHPRHVTQQGRFRQSRKGELEERFILDYVEAKRLSCTDLVCHFVDDLLGVGGDLGLSDEVLSGDVDSDLL